MLKRFHLKPIVFAGSSLQLVAAEARAKFDVRPPAKRGDLEVCLNSSAHKYHRILLVDGVFGSEMSVSPHECRKVLAAGHVLIGCSSMGALRAADCSDIGMIGFGKIFLGFVAGYYRSDADVAVVYDRETQRELGLSFVFCESVLKAMSQTNQITKLEYRFVRRAIAQIPWSERFLPQVLRAAGQFLLPPPLELLKRHLNDPKMDPKKTDCAHAVQTLLEILK